jgi:hypothetical protein
MAVKAGQIIHVGNGNVLIDRIQTGGPGQLNIPTEKINELGNYKSVATVRDIPDLQFTLESLDSSTEIEQLLCGVTAIPANGLDLATVVPLDIASQFKAGLSETDPSLVTASVAVPYVYPESVSYRFGLRDNASQQISLRGDSIFYNPGGAFVQSAAGTGTAGQTIVTANAAFQAAIPDGRRVLSVSVGDKRLTFGADYTETYGAVASGAAVTTVTLKDAVPASKNVRIMYSGPTAVQYPQTVHPDPAVKPAAVKGRDIEIYVGGYDPADLAGSLQYKFPSVQSVNVDWRVTLDRDEEFGNAYAVAQDFDVPAVTGTITVKPRGADELLKLVRQITGVTDVTKAIGPDSAVPLSLDIVLLNPNETTRTVMKRLHVPDARFTVPGFQGQVQQKLTVDLPMESDEGTLLVFNS